MPFGLTNRPATFQADIDDCVHPYIYDFIVCYIYPTKEKEHEDHVPNVLQCLQEFGLYCKAEKWQFRVREVSISRFVIHPDGIGMELDRISMIEDWRTPESVRDMEVLLGFTNVYRGLIWKNGTLTASISTLLIT